MIPCTAWAAKGLKNRYWAACPFKSSFYCFAHRRVGHCCRRFHAQLGQLRAWKIGTRQLAAPFKRKFFATERKQLRTKENHRSWHFQHGILCSPPGPLLGPCCQFLVPPPPREGSIPLGPPRKEIARNCAQNMFWHLFPSNLKIIH